MSGTVNGLLATRLAAGAPPGPGARSEPAAAAGRPSVAAELAALERVAAGHGVALRPGRAGDLAPILEFSRRWLDLPPARRRNGYDVYRILQYGQASILERGGELVAYDLAVSYAGNPPVSGTAGVAVHPAWKGRGLGTALVRYSMARALAAGAAFRRGIVSPRNVSSLTLHLNHLGFVCDRFHPSFADWGESRLTLRRALAFETLRPDPLDPGLLASFLAGAEDGADYLLLDPADDSALAEVYAAGGFQVAAVVPGRAGGARLLALPVERPAALAGVGGGRG